MIDCPDCNGVGEVVDYTNSFGLDEMKPCRTCRATGEITLEHYSEIISFT